MNGVMLLFSFLCLLIGVFVFKKLWIGAFCAVLVLLIPQLFLASNPYPTYYLLLNTLIIWTELILLIFGAYLFYFTLSFHQHFDSFTANVSTLNSRIVLAIILCFFIGGFMEGIAGFGIPALLIAPLMLNAGFKPITAIVLPLASNTTAVLFGALGTPLKIGLNIHQINEAVLKTLLINALPALFVPFMLIYLLSQTEGLKIAWSKEWKILLGAGICFYLPFVLAGLLSIEFPSVAAGIIGLMLFLLVFVPSSEKIAYRIWWQTFLPYLFFILLLLIVKLIFQNHSFRLTTYTKPVSFFQPGLVFIIATFGVLFYFNQSSFGKQFFNLAKVSLHKIGFPALSIFLLICFSQLSAQMLSENISNFTSKLNTSWQIIVQPLIGICGSFITGSATMSNLLFAESLNAINSTQLGLLTALLHTGSAIGNAISLQNIILVKTVIPDNISERKILKFNLPVVGLYILLVLLSVLIIVNFT